MIHAILSRIPFLRKSVDERFLEHRRRSTSMAGMVCLIMTGVLIEYHYFADHFFSWELMSLILIYAVVKFSMMAWYRFRG